MKVNIDLTNLPSIINPKFYPLLFDDSSYLVLRGGAGSGKSELAAAKIFFRILADYNKPFKHRFLALKKTLPYARRTVFPLLKDYVDRWGLQKICHVNNTQMTFTFENGSDIWVMGLDDAEKVKSITGVTSIWMEEATEFSVEDFQQLDLRMRGKIDTYYQILLTFNPISALNWVYKEFFENPRPGTKTHFSTYKDNLFLDDKYKDKLEDLVNRDYMKYKVYCLGEWGSLENVIYKKWEKVPAFPGDCDDLALGLDFGYTHPAALVQLGVDRKEGKLFVKELLHREGMTTSRLIEVMDKLITPDSLFTKRTPIYCDNSRPEAIAQLREAGYNALAVAKGKNTVKEGIDLVKQYKLRITQDSFNVIKEIGEYKWKEDKDGNVYEEPVKINDDAMDAMRYAAFMTLRKKQELAVIFMDM